MWSEDDNVTQRALFSSFNKGLSNEQGFGITIFSA